MDDTRVNGARTQDTMDELLDYVRTPPPASSLRDQWKEIFSGDLQAIKAMGISGQLATSPFRSVCWKMFLGALDDMSTKTWIEKTKESRVKYDKLFKKYVTDLKEKMKTEADLAVNNPLSQEEESPWKRFFEDTELQRTIQQDVERTYPDQQFFHTERIQAMMLDNLFIFSRQNESISYRQGMHELLALVIWVVDSGKVSLAPIDTTGPNAETDKLIFTMLHPDYVGHDAYIIFEHIMQTTLTWFDTGSRPTPSQAAQSNELINEGSTLFGKPISEATSSSTTTAVIRKCHRVQHQLIKQYDPRLYEHLSHLGIEPQLYGIRWMRLLFGREFHIADVLRLWDGIFADDPYLGVVDYMCVSMLLFLREQLLQADYSIAMSRLMKYPPVEDVVWLLERAIQIRDLPLDRKPVPLNQSQQLQQLQHSSNSRGTSPALAGAKQLAARASAQFSRNKPTQQQQQQQQQQDEKKRLAAALGRASTVSYTSSGRSGNASSAASSSYSAPSIAVTSPGFSQSQQDLVDAAFEREKDLTQQLAGMRNINDQLAIQIAKGLAVLKKELSEHAEDRAFNQETVNLAMAALKQVRDILSGELSFSPEVLRSNDEAFNNALGDDASKSGGFATGPDALSDEASTNAIASFEQGAGSDDSDNGAGAAAAASEDSDGITPSNNPIESVQEPPQSSSPAPVNKFATAPETSAAAKTTTPTSAVGLPVPVNLPSPTNTPTPAVVAPPQKKVVDVFADIDDDDPDFFFSGKSSSKGTNVKTSGLENLLD